MNNKDNRRTDVGVRFKLFREMIDRTSKQLAEELEILESEIVSIEDGRIFPDIIYLHYLHEHYGLNINWMLGEVGEMFSSDDPKRMREIFAAKAAAQLPAARFEKYLELLELMEIPAVEQAIMATLLEIKTLLKKQNNEK